MSLTRPSPLPRLKAITQGRESGEIHRALPNGSWEALHQLPSESKDELWTRFSGDPTLRWLLGEYIVGDDIAWLEHALDRELITPDHAADTYSAFALHPSIEQMARLLVPRGIEPRRIAFLAQAGSWTGEESHRYGQIAEEFEALKGSDDASVAAVGNAGAEMFSAARDDALRDERKRRIRGDP